MKSRQKAETDYAYRIQFQADRDGGHRLYLTSADEHAAAIAWLEGAGIAFDDLDALRVTISGAYYVMPYLLIADEDHAVLVKTAWA